jgi:spermidine/putrescine transport system permease protein
VNTLQRFFVGIGGSFLMAITYLFLYIPIIVLVVFSFNRAAFPSPWVGFTLRWYQELYYSEELWHALTASLTVASLATISSLMLGIMFIIYVYLLRHESVSMLAFFYGNLVIPDIVLSVGLLTLFSFFTVPLGMPTLIVAHTVLGISYVIPLVYARFKEIDYRLTEASLDLGATYWQTFVKVILPLLAPSFLAAGLLLFALSFDDFVFAYFCAGSSSQTLPLYIFSMIRAGVSPTVNALSTFLLAASSLVVILFCYLQIRVKVF